MVVVDMVNVGRNIGLSIQGERDIYIYIYLNEKYTFRMWYRTATGLEFRNRDETARVNISYQWIRDYLLIKFAL